MSDPTIVCKRCGRRRVIRLGVSGVPRGTPESARKTMRRNCELRKASGADCDLHYFAGVDAEGIRRALLDATGRNK